MPNPSGSNPGASRLAPAERAVRNAAIIEARVKGASLATLAARWDLTEGGVSRIVSAHFAAVKVESAEILVKYELDKLDRMEAAVWTVLDAEHFYVSHGRIMYRYDVGPHAAWDAAAGEWVGGDPTPLRDSAPVLQSVDRLVRIQQRRAMLLGLDRPTESVVRTYDYTVNGVDMNAAFGGPK